MFNVFELMFMFMFNVLELGIFNVLEVEEYWYLIFILIFLMFWFLTVFEMEEKKNYVW